MSTYPSPEIGGFANLSVPQLSFLVRERLALDSRSIPIQGSRTFFEKQANQLLGFPKRIGNLKWVRPGLNGEIEITQWRDTRVVVVDGVITKPSRAKPGYDYEDHTPKGKPAEEKRPVVYPTMEKAIRGFEHILEGTHGRQSDQMLATRSQVAMMEDFSEQKLATATAEDLKAFAAKRYQFLVDNHFLDAENHEKQQIAQTMLGAWDKPNYLIFSSKTLKVYRRVLIREYAIAETIRKYSYLSYMLHIVRNQTRLVVGVEAVRLQNLINEPFFANPNFAAETEEQMHREAQKSWWTLQKASVRLDKAVKFNPYAQAVWRTINDWGTAIEPRHADRYGTVEFPSVIDPKIGEELCDRRREWVARRESNIPTVTDLFRAKDYEGVREMLYGSIAAFKEVLEKNKHVDPKNPKQDE